MANSKLKTTKQKPAAKAKKTKKVKSVLVNSENLLDAVFHTADIGIAIVNTDGKVIKANDGYCSLFGYGCGELIGKPWFKVIAPSDRKAVKLAHAKIAHGEKLRHERKAIRKDGKLIDIYLTNTLLKNADGTQYIIKTVRDITESTKYKNLLHQAERITKLGAFEFDFHTNDMIWTDELFEICEMEKKATVNLSEVIKYYKTEYVDEIALAVNDARNKGKRFVGEWEFVTPHNNTKWLRVTGDPILTKSKTVELIGTVQDITEKKLAELEIERLTWVAKHTNSAVVISNPHGKIEWVNTSFEKLTGYKLKEIIGVHPGDFLQGTRTDKETVKRVGERLRNHLPSTGEVLLNYNKQGEPIWISSDIAPIFKNGKLINFVGIMTDLTDVMQAKEIKEQQEVLLQKQQMFKAISKYFPNGIIGIVNPDLRYVFVGGTELKKLGLNHHEMIGDKIFDNIHPESNEYAEPFLKRAFTGEKISFELTISGKIYLVTAVPVNAKVAPVNQVLIVIQNITESKKSQEELMNALQKQKELNELKSKFVSIASHEFRTPLSTILSSSFLVGKYNKPEDDERKEKHLERIKNSVNNLTDILNDFLSVGKIEEGGIKNRPGLFNVRSFFSELQEEMQGYLKPGQQIIYSHKGKSEMVYLDRQHFKNVHINLLSNAIKYSEENKTIHLTSLFDNHTLRVKVRDEGIGIPEADQKHLFETFFRANNVSNIQGTGMGLHIVKKYLDIMGGSIEFTSAENQGSTFTTSYPQTIITDNMGS